MVVAPKKTKDFTVSVFVTEKFIKLDITADNVTFTSL